MTTIPEAQAARTNLEQDIAALLQDIAALLVKFNRETGAKVTDIRISLHFGSVNYIVYVDVRL